MKIIAISDTHCQLNKIKLPYGDILIHSGDLTNRGSIQEIAKELNELKKYKDQFKKIILIAGNHDLLSEENPNLMKQMCIDNGIEYLCDSGYEIDGIKIWGSPVQPEFNDWAWNRNSFEIIKHWNAIPDDINILVTHGPPYGILDQTTYANGDLRPGFLGCPRLLERIKELKDLDLHFFGHIHHPGGQQKHLFGKSFYNCAICDEIYCPTNGITIVEYQK